MEPLTEEERANLRGSLMTLRIIVFALIMGVSTFVGYSVFARIPQVPPQQPAGAAPGMIPLHHAIAIGAGTLAAVIAFIVPPFIPGPKVETGQNDPRSLAIIQAAATLQMRTIIACSLVEGAAFFNGFYVLSDFSLPNLAMVGVLLIVMAMHFPLTGSYFDKVERLMGVDRFAGDYAPRKPRL